MNEWMNDGRPAPRNQITGKQIGAFFANIHPQNVQDKALSPSVVVGCYCFCWMEKKAHSTKDRALLYQKTGNTVSMFLSLFVDR